MRFALILTLLTPLFAQPNAASLEGRVTNLISGGPVRKAKVQLGEQNNARYTTVTDANGHYVFTGIAPGRYQLWVQRTGFLPSYFGAHGPNRPGKSILLAASESRHNVDFSLEAPAVVTGHIYDQEGEPLSTAVVLYRESWQNGQKRIVQAGGANADDEGMYRAFGLPAGTYIVATLPTPIRVASPVPTREIYPPTFYPSTEDGTSATPLKLGPGGEARNIDIRVRKTVAVNVQGTLVAQSLTPDLRMSLLRRDGYTNNLNNFMFPQRGQFEARNVTPGAYILSARSNTEYARMDLDVGTLDIQGLELRLAPTLELPATLKFDGEEPPSGTMFSLTLTSGTQGDVPASALVDKEHHATWKGLVPGKWTLDFAPKLPGLFLKSPTEIEIAPDGHTPIEVVISSQGAAINGKVQTAAENKTAVEAATVLLVNEAGKVIQHALTNLDGNYTLSRIPPGKYRLFALEDIETNSWESPDFSRAWQNKGTPIELAPAEKSTHDLSLTLP